MKSTSKLCIIDQAVNIKMKLTASFMYTIIGMMMSSSVSVLNIITVQISILPTRVGM